MNITPSTIYWISVLDDMLCVAVILAILSGIAGVIMLVVALVAYFNSDDDEGIARLNRLLAVNACAFFASIVTCIFSPSAKTCAAMYVVPAIANSEKLQGVTDGIYDLAIDWLKELKPAKSKSEKGEAK